MGNEKYMMISSLDMLGQEFCDQILKWGKKPELLKGSGPLRCVEVLGLVEPHVPCGKEFPVAEEKLCILRWPHPAGFTQEHGMNKACDSTLALPITTWCNKATSQKTVIHSSHSTCLWTKDSKQDVEKSTILLILSHANRKTGTFPCSELERESPGPESSRSARSQDPYTRLVLHTVGICRYPRCNVIDWFYMISLVSTLLSSQFIILRAYAVTCRPNAML